MPTQSCSTGRFGRFLLIVAVAALSACGGRSAPPATAPAPGAPRTSGAQASRPNSAGPEFDATRLYSQMGLIAAGAPLPFVGAVTYLATQTPDSTDVTLGLTLANSALSFNRENDRFVGGYTVGLTFRQGSTMVRDISAHETVRLATYKETSRLDESIVFQQGVLLPPGRYVVSASVRDDGSGRTNTQEMPISVPKVGTPGTLSSPIPFLQVTPRRSRAAVAELVGNPRSTVTFGLDTTAALYVEGYGDGARMPVTVEVRSDAARVLWREEAALPRHGDLFSGVVSIPVSRIGIGAVMVTMWPTGSADTVRTPIFVGFGAGLPVARYEDMIQYLRWFAPAYRLKTLRDTIPEARPAAWAACVKSTDSNPMTPANEALLAYFTRLAEASTRFKEEGTPGWLTDRGKVYLGLGEPSQTYEQGLAGYGTRGRSQVWEYRGLNIQLVFYDQTGFGRWRLTNSSEMEFQSQWQRRTSR